MTDSAAARPSRVDQRKVKIRLLRHNIVQRRTLGTWLRLGAWFGPKTCHDRRNHLPQASDDDIAIITENARCISDHPERRRHGREYQPLLDGSMARRGLRQVLETVRHLY